MLSYYYLIPFVVSVAVNAITVAVSGSGGKAVHPLQYGLMFEDINHSGDGGMQNRAFQGTSSIFPWTAVGGASLTLGTTSPAISSALSKSVAINGAANATVGLSNPGWWGIEVKLQAYTGSFYVMGDYSGSFTAQLKSSSGAVLASASISSNSKTRTWTKHTFTLTPSTKALDVKNTFVLTFTPINSSQTLNFNLISLFPPTYNNRPNGMRIELMEALKAMNPSFLRLPGGNNVEGNKSPNHWKWSQTIGDLTQRPGRSGTWGYYNTDGLGLVEYMHWCQDLNMEPVLAFPAGLYLDGTIVSQSALQALVNDAMNELEFLMGDSSTIYGKLRVDLGYDDPFPIKYVEIGNEDNLNKGQSSYNSYRYSMFYNAIIAKYPNMEIIASTRALSPQPGKTIQDDHEYNTPDAFAAEFNTFDSVSTSHKILVGEYAAVQANLKTGANTDWGKPFQSYPWWIGAVSEAIFELGGEKNADKVIGFCYAPLLQNINSHQWHPDLISFSADTSQTALSTSYQQIKLFSINRMTTVLPLTNSASYGPAYWVAGVNNNSNTYIFKSAVYNTSSSIPFQLTFPGQTSGATAQLTIMTAPNAYSSVTPGGSNPVTTNTQTITTTSSGFNFSLPQWSIAVLTMKGSGSGGVTGDGSLVSPTTLRT
ncbi:alpha-L-arabinofuranosidase 2 [Lindgomyces ingoldianus]|uniref:Alpha-L-arabinofuranosidase 2 n=1 Tax=Lindgomyces ingoldianus TaxID=673940 RepID=A0ACB6Q7W7_9PLEO|nr:alpha-L-arabinofuranosidase 2 [Lindgomyces ingoldianus]KAF2462978.1 alpha-L-arabinofuranosidase 2 [Lindgomyces ingoldianus]